MFELEVVEEPCEAELDPEEDEEEEEEPDEPDRDLPLVPAVPDEDEDEEEPDEPESEPPFAPVEPELLVRPAGPVAAHMAGAVTVTKTVVAAGAATWAFEP